MYDKAKTVSFEERLARLTSIKSPNKKRLDPDCLHCEGNGFIFFENGMAGVGAKICNCSRDIIEEKIRIDPILRKIENAKIPVLYLAAKGGTFAQEIESWFEKLMEGSFSNPNLFLYGHVGSGKTHTACGLIFKFFESKGYKESALYVPAYDFLKKLKNKHLSGFSHDKISSTEASKSFDELFKAMVQVKFLVLDEVGHLKLTDNQVTEFLDLIDKRYASKFITVFISNHGEEKSRSLNSKSLQDMIGERLASRINSCFCYYFSGEDLRKLDQKENITAEEVRDFKMHPIAYTGSETKRHIMNWLVRNPVFETVSTKQRQELTYIDSNGNERDRDRPEPKERKDVWEKGDHLIVQGPICDYEDAKLYIELVHQLALVHKGGETGLSIEISLQQIADLIGLSTCGQTWDRIRRQLDRLTNMSIQFRNSKNNRWVGSLLFGTFSVGSGPQTRILIRFNEFMIPFYRQVHLTLLGSEELKDLSGDAIGLYSFYSSQQNSKMGIGFEKLFQILDIPNDTPKKGKVRRVRSAIKKLKEEGVMSAESNVKNEVLHSHMIKD